MRNTAYEGLIFFWRQQNGHVFAVVLDVNRAVDSCLDSSVEIGQNLTDC